MPDLDLVQWLAAYGLLAALVLAFLERVLLFIPSYVLFVGMGTVLAQDLESLPLLVLISAAGSTLGASLWFCAGAWLGAERCRALFQRWQSWLFFSVERYDALVERFRSHARSVVFVSQTIPTVRIFIALPAGVIGMPAGPYLLVTFLGCLVWNGGLILAGALLQETGLDLPWLIFLVLGTIVLIELAVLAFYRHRRIRRGGASSNLTSAGVLSSPTVDSGRVDG